MYKYLGNFFLRKIRNRSILYTQDVQDSAVIMKSHIIIIIQLLLHSGYTGHDFFCILLVSWYTFSHCGIHSLDTGQNLF